MFKIMKARLDQGYRTMAYPKGPAPTLPERFRGLPRFDTSRCPPDCGLCADACPTDAISLVLGKPSEIDLGRCLFCSDCTRACPEKAISFSDDYRLAVRERKDLVLSSESLILNRAQALEKKIKKLFGRSLTLRQVSAGGCNACEADVNVLSTIGWDLGRFGIQFTASPRHADGLLITGPITQNMVVALKKTYAAVPRPKIVIAVGACAISGGPYLNQPEANNGADSFLKVDLYIPGCPPHPLTILDGFLRFLGKLEKEPSL